MEGRTAGGCYGGLANASPPNILIVEDDSEAQELLRSTLEVLSYRVDTADTGVIAVEKWERGEFDLIITDIQMPRMNGLEATRLIREREKRRGGYIPIVALTGYADAAGEAECFAAGLDACLSKPLDLEEGLKVIERLLHAGRP